MPSMCRTCGEPVEIDRKGHAVVCLRCAPPSVTKALTGPYREPGVWRVGPVVFDWDGAVSVARCDECSFSVLRFGERCYLTAINHAILWHATRRDAAQEVIEAAA